MLVLITLHKEWFRLYIQGDSGGPFMVKKGDQHVVVGVVSTVTGPPVPPGSGYLELFFPKKKRNCGKTTAFCRVSEARGWIEQTLQERHGEYCHYGLDANHVS